MRSSVLVLSLPLSLLSVGLVGCASNTIVPSYQNSNPNLQVGGERPLDLGPKVENAGSFCLEIVERWHQDGETPDGQALWAKDTARRVVPCGS